MGTACAGHSLRNLAGCEGEKVLRASENFFHEVGRDLNMCNCREEGTEREHSKGC